MSLFSFKKTAVATLLGCVGASAFAVDSIYTLTSALTSIQQMMLTNRSLSNSTTTLTGGGTNPYNYAGVLVTASASGSYTLGMLSAPVDTTMGLFSSFNRSNPGAALAFNDDGVGANIGGSTVVRCGSVARQCPNLTYTLNSGTQYYLVVSTYSPNAPLSLPFDFASSGVGTLSFVPLPSAAAFTPNSTTNSHGAAAVLDALNGGTGAMATAITALGGLSNSQQTAALEHLAPASSRAIQVSAMNGMNSTFNQVSARLDAMKLSGGQYDSPLLSFSGGLQRGLASGDEPAVSGVWLKGFGLEGRQDKQDNFAGYKSSGWGVATGADRRFAPGVIAGIALSYSETAVNYKDQLNGDSSRAKSSQASLYGSKDYGRFFVDGMLAYSIQDYSSRRDTVVNGFAEGDYHGDQWGARLSAGMPVAVSVDTVITPIARVEWNKINQDAYSEKSGGALALNVASASAERVRSSLGAQVNHDTTLFGVKARPYAHAFWNHDFRNNGIDSSASFVGGGTTFVTQGQKLDRDTYTVGGGINFFNRQGFTASAGYDLTLGNEYTSHTAQASARWDF